MSVVIFSRGSFWNSSHVQRADFPVTSLSVKSHLSTGLRGVGPAERTGKSRVSYWPGGSRDAASLLGRRPRNPREIGGISALVQVTYSPSYYNLFDVALRFSVLIFNGTPRNCA